MPPVDADELPLWKLLSDLLDERRLSKRRFAKMLYERDPRQTWESWRSSVKRYTRSEDPTTPSDETTRLMEAVLDVPAGTLVRPPRREVQEERIRLLQERVRWLEAELEKRDHEHG